MEPTKELIDDIYAEKVRRARGTPIEQKLSAGPRLFRAGCEAMRAGIRAQHPQATSEEVERILRDRLAQGRQLEQSRDRR